MAYVPPAKRNQASASYSQASYSSRGPSRSDTSSWRKGASAAPVLRAENEDERRVTGAGVTVIVPLDVAREWKALRHNDVALDNVTKDQLQAWHNLVMYGEVTHLSHIEPIVRQLEPEFFFWAINLILDRGSSMKGSSRDTLLRSVGEEIRYNSNIAGEYYHPVPYLVYGNFSLWKEKEIRRDGEDVRSDELIEKTPAISVMTALVHQAWLKTGMTDVKSEFPLTSIHWEDLVDHLRYVDFLHRTKAHDVETFLHEYNNLHIDAVTPYQFALLTAGSRVLPYGHPTAETVHTDRVEKVELAKDQERMERRLNYQEKKRREDIRLDKTVSVKSYASSSTASKSTYRSLITYDVGSVDDRMAMGRPTIYNDVKATPSNWDDSDEEEEESFEAASRLISLLPGSEEDAMFLFSALVEYYSKTEEMTKALKLRTMGLQHLANPKVFSEPYDDFTWPIMREVLYSGALSYDYTILPLIIPDMETVAKNLHHRLSPSAFSALKDFLSTVTGVPESLLVAMNGRRIGGEKVSFTGETRIEYTTLLLPKYVPSLPILVRPSAAEIAEHDRAARRYNKIHGFDPKKKREEERRKREEAEEKKREEKRRKEAEKEALIASMAAKKEEAKRKREEAELKKRQEAIRRAEEYKRRMAKNLPKLEDEE